MKCTKMIRDSTSFPFMFSSLSLTIYCKLLTNTLLNISKFLLNYLNNSSLFHKKRPQD